MDKRTADRVLAELNQAVARSYRPLTVSLVTVDAEYDDEDREEEGGWFRAEVTGSQFSVGRMLAAMGVALARGLPVEITAQDSKITLHIGADRPAS